MKAHVLFMAATAAMLLSIGAIAEEASAEKDGWPFIVIRHTRYLNDSPETFAKLIDCHRRHPGVCDEFWFSTGARKTVDEIRAVAETIASFRPLCDETGIKLSVQQAVSLGHSSNWMDGDTAKFPESAMQQDRNGKLLRNILCPRAPEALAYEREVVKTVLSVAKPYSYWLDDDLRMGMRSMPNGCFCPRCVKAFNEETNGAWTREALAAAVFDKPGNQPVRAAWSEFNARSLATFAATVRRAADEIRSPCRLAVQTTVSDTLWCGKDFRPTLEALSGPARQSVGIRPGGGFYVEAEPRRMIEKSLFIVREAERCRDFGGLVGTVCYEEDNYPWRMLHKSPGAIMTEGALALASGCDSLSLYWYSHAAPEPIEEYDRFLRTLAKARPYFERLAASTRRTRLGGVARFVGSAAGESKEFCLRSHFDNDLACAGIPVTVPESGTKTWYVTEKSRSEMTDADKATVAGQEIAKRNDRGRQGDSRRSCRGRSGHWEVPAGEPTREAAGRPRQGDGRHVSRARGRLPSTPHPAACPPRRHGRQRDLAQPFHRRHGRACHPRAKSRGGTRRTLRYERRFTAIGDEAGQAELEPLPCQVAHVGGVDDRADDLVEVVRLRLDLERELVVFRDDVVPSGGKGDQPVSAVHVEYRELDEDADSSFLVADLGLQHDCLVVVAQNVAQRDSFHLNISCCSGCLAGAVCALPCLSR